MSPRQPRYRFRVPTSASSAELRPNRLLVFRGGHADLPRLWVRADGQREIDQVARSPAGDDACITEEVEMADDRSDDGHDDRGHRTDRAVSRDGTHDRRRRGGELRLDREFLTPGTRVIVALAALVLALGTLSACGGDDGEEEAADPAITETQPTDTAPAEDGEAPSGEQVFVDTGCGSCHTLAAADATGTIGPDLDETVTGESVDRIRMSIVDPDAEITEGFSEGVMPSDYGEQLSEAEIDALAKFIAQNAGG